MKKLIALAALACAAFAASAEYMYLNWMVDVTGNSDYGFNYATIKARDANGNTSDYLSLYGTDSATPVGTRLYASNYGEASNYEPGLTTGYGAFAGIGGYNQFLVELWTDGATASDPANRVAFGWLTYNQVKNNIFEAGNLSGATAFTVDSTMLVPEPTTGLLVLLGLAGLALRRKQEAA